MFRALYKPANGSYEEVFEDAETLEELSPGAILIVKINEDGTREIIEQKENPTPKEETFIHIGERHAEFKHDGGDTPEMFELRKNAN